MEVRRRGLLATVGTAAVAGCLGSEGTDPASLGAIAVLNRHPAPQALTVVFRREDFMDGNYTSGEGPVRVPAANYEDGRLRGSTLVTLGSDWPDDVRGVGLRSDGERVYGAIDLRDVNARCVNLVFTVDPLGERRSATTANGSPTATESEFPATTASESPTTSGDGTADGTPTGGSDGGRSGEADYGLDLVPCDADVDFLGTSTDE